MDYSGYSDIPWGVLSLAAAGYALMDLYVGEVAPLVFIPVLLAFFLTARMRVRKGHLSLNNMAFGAIALFVVFIVIMAIYEGVFSPLIPYTLIENNLHQYLGGVTCIVILCVGFVTGRERYFFTGGFGFVSLILANLLFKNGQAAFIMTFGSIGTNMIAFGIRSIEKNVKKQPKVVEQLIVEMTEEELAEMIPPEKPKRKKRELPLRIGGFVRRPVMRFKDNRPKKRYVLVEKPASPPEELHL